MNKNILFIFFICSILNGLTSVTAIGANVSNSYVFIENNVDNEFFITPRTTDPRFSGSNKYTRYSGDSQRSLGYMGYVNTGIVANRNIDIWLENSQIDRPFTGNRCMRGYCNDNSGYWPAQYLGKDGAYKIVQSNTNGQSNYARGIFSDSAYQYFLTLPVGSAETYSYRACMTTTDYDPSKGESCRSVGGNIIASHEFNITKSGHIKLTSTGALQEIFIDSNGNPSIGLGSQFCRIGIIGNQNGIICQVIDHETKGDIFNNIRLSLKINSTLIPFTPAANSILIGPDDGTNRWYNYNTTYQANYYFQNSNKHVSIFLSNTFLKLLISRGIDFTNSQEFFTFSFTNTAVPESGYYEFTPSNMLIIKPRDYGISIIPTDFNPKQSKTGKVGNDEPPIEFNYIVTTSGPRQADSITAKVDGPTITLKGRTYCLFSSDDDKFKVPFSAYLSFKNENGSQSSYRANCDSNEISLKNAFWEETPWDKPNQDLGSFYRTHLDLSFPMNDSNSFFTLDGIDWLGTVSASGTVVVKAIWTGPDIQ
ncbi:fimbrial protein [Providencia vermicola]|uniref:Fimbrial protein n=1 Tax=Providencia vermicola TaxID=333965 RepID=A0AAX3S299_9GAMM|nr:MULTISPECIES: fimbrial protein [Providencia]MCK1144686.1 fimbrial protein [Providencia stuartii]MCR4181082.1 fimbrial protein [Providencia vermicola]URE79579.1 fimbrial protein [Providencia stuartii]USB38648.1 fimbrial protein [Providencia vermicola]WBA56333.1 fimbrial protein [Providencia sp. 21OH12SH02B-Prov]